MPVALVLVVDGRAPPTIKCLARLVLDSCSRLRQTLSTHGIVFEPRDRAKML